MYIQCIIDVYLNCIHVAKSIKFLWNMYSSFVKSWKNLALVPPKMRAAIVFSVNWCVPDLFFPDPFRGDESYLKTVLLIIVMFLIWIIGRRVSKSLISLIFYFHFLSLFFSLHDSFILVTRTIHPSRLIYYTWTNRTDPPVNDSFNLI